MTVLGLSPGWVDDEAVVGADARRLSERRRRVRGSLVAVAAAAVPFLLALWNFGIRPLRTATPDRMFSQFFDIQARSLLDGRLAVPEGSLGFEAFRHDGNEYMYFGLLPSLLRLPIHALTDDLYARLTAPSMLLAWIVTAVLTSLLVWRIRAVVAPDRPVSRFELIACCGLIAFVLGGSPLLYLAALPWVYSEALMWSTAMAIGAFYSVVGLLERPTWDRVLVASAFTLGAVLTRVTAGWGSAVTVIAVGALFVIARRHRARRRWGPVIIAAGAAPLLIGIAINYAKFGHPLLIPFDSQVWTELSARRREVLEQGGVTGVRFLPATLFNYLRPDGIRLTTIFPFVTPPASPARPVGGVTLDMMYRTPSITAVMPLVWIPAVVGGWRILRPRAPQNLAILRIPLLGALLILAGMLGVGYITPRYIVEFVPALLIAAVVGIAILAWQARGWTVMGRRVAIVGAALLAAYGTYANLAIATASARIHAGGTSLQQYVRWQERVLRFTGQSIGGRVSVGAAFPDRSLPDSTFVVGDCTATAFGTGDLYFPWVLIESRPLDIEIRLAGQPEGMVELAVFRGYHDRVVSIEFLDFHYRLVIDRASEGDARGEWRPAAPGTHVTVNISADLDRGRYFVESPGYVRTSMSIRQLRPDLVAEIAVPESLLTPEVIEEFNLDVDVSMGSPTELCRRFTGQG